MVPSFTDVQDAARRIAPHAIRTPLVESAVLNALTGGRVFLKLETLQRTGSFKFRGACNRLAMIPQDERGNGVVAFSSGNHAQGVAAAAQLFGMPAVIVMPSDAPRPKIEGTRAFGAKIIEYDRVTDDREAIAQRIREECGATLVKPYDDAAIIAGQGTAGLEIAEDAARLGVALDEVLSPCSGGGLAVSDEDLERAVSFAARKLKLLVEPGGAAALAALLSGKLDARGKAVALILSGGNAEFGTVAAAVARYPS